MKRNTIEASYRVVTPMFLGGASPQELADAVRPPSIKGALRFWWRFLNWPRVRQAADGDDAQALRLLHRDEAQLFGHAAENDKLYGQSRFLLRTIMPNPTWKATAGWPRNNTGSGYLGLGLFEFGHGANHRKAYREGQTFDLQLLPHPDMNPEQRTQLEQCLVAWGLFGGLGGRGQRRGFGSVALLRLGGRDWRCADADDYRRKAGELLQAGRSLGQCPPFTALWKDTEFRIVHRGDDARAVHDELGTRFKRYRGDPAGSDSGLRGEQKVPFGLPLAKVDNRQRRASPLLFHVHPIGQGFAGCLLYMPAEFHPKYPKADLRAVTQFVAYAKEARP